MSTDNPNENSEPDRPTTEPEPSATPESAPEAAEDETYPKVPYLDQKTPSTARARLKPFEFIGMSLIFSLFVGLVVLLALRNPLIAGVAFVGVLVVTLVVLAMFTLSTEPRPKDLKRPAKRGH